MANQIVVSAGAKVRDLQDVIIGTSGVLSSLAFDVANGVPRLDVNGKILVSQLPNSVMEYKGTWDAATNTPTLANGTGNQGDVYLCNVAGTVNFGAGAIAFFVGDQVIYSGSIWQRASGATGTVTSVAITESGDSLNITGSPITTSGTINIGFNGTNLQYVNGAGNLTTFPTLITSIGLSMPSAFSVANSPLTANGTIAVTGAGTTAQYIRGDGSLATFPTISAEAQRLITEVYNETGATLTKGTVVYINGGHGNLPTITKAIATGDATSAQTYGIVQTDITDMNNGYVVVVGSLTDLDTQAYANGTQLYLSSTTAGAWTSTKQYAPAHLVYVGIVTRSHPTQGVVEVRIQNGFEMDELHNVSAQTPLNNQGLFYNTSTSLWENKSIATALGYTPANDALVVHLAGTETITGAKTFSGYTTFTSTVDITSGLTFSNSGFTLVLQPPTLSVNRTVTLPNGTGTLALTSDISYPVTSVFGRTGAVVATEGDYSLTQLSDVTITSPTTNQVLKYNGSAWVNDTDANTGTVTSVAMTVPTGLSVSGSPITTSGTLAVSLASGYSIPTTSSQATWDTAYSLRITTASLPLVLIGNLISMNQATALQNGFLTYTDFTTFNNKQNALTLTTTGTSGAATLVGATLNIPQYADAYTGTVTSVAALTIGTSGTDLSSTVANSTTTPVITLNVPTASATNRGALSSADWTTFNNKQSALTNPVTGTGTTNYLPKFTGASTIGNSGISDNGSLISVGLNTLFSGYIDGLGLRATSSSAFGGTGVGVEIGYSGGLGYVQAYNRSTSAYQPIKVDGSTVSLNISGVQKLFLDASGNLGLGVTPSAWASLVPAIQINNAAIAGNNNADLYLTANAYYNSGWKYIQTTTANLYQMEDGIHSWHTAPSGTAGNAITFTQAMTLTAAGRLLLGTTFESTYLLDVNGTGRFSGNVVIGYPTDSNQSIPIELKGMALTDGTSLYGNYGGILLSANNQFTSSAKRYLITNGLNANVFAIIRSVDATTNPTLGTNGALSSGVVDFKIDGTGAASFYSSVTATGFFESSDSRLKTLIQDNYQTKGIASITPKLYTKNGKVELGYYAQDFVGILDSAVSKGSDDMLSLSYREVLVAKVYALEQRIKELENN